MNKIINNILENNKLKRKQPLIYYKVLIFDDELAKKRWRPVIFKIEDKVNSNVYRALLGSQSVKPELKYTTPSYEEAVKKLNEMKEKGWKAKIITVSSEDE